MRAAGGEGAACVPPEVKVLMRAAGGEGAACVPPEVKVLHACRRRRRL